VRKRQPTKLKQEPETKFASPAWRTPQPAPLQIYSGAHRSLSKAKPRCSSNSSLRSAPGSILIDATVALAASAWADAPPARSASGKAHAAQQAAELVPKGVSVAAAFHNLSAELLNGDHPLDCDVIVCSDDADATSDSRESFAAKLPGVRAIDGGKLENARILEQITALLIGLNIRHKGHGGIRITGLPPQAYE
jgi:predicted dinucleotide-binding enzyme